MFNALPTAGIKSSQAGVGVISVVIPAEFRRLYT
jgi:hypothetical protein